jgi:hypothetical protein
MKLLTITLKAAFDDTDPLNMERVADSIVKLVRDCTEAEVVFTTQRTIETYDIGTIDFRDDSSIVEWQEKARDIMEQSK